MTKARKVSLLFILSAFCMISCAEKDQSNLKSRMVEDSKEKAEVLENGKKLVFSLDSEEVPEAVKAGALSILKLRSVSENTVESHLREVDLSSEKLIVKVKSDIMSLKAEHYSDADKFLLLNQVEACAKDTKENSGKCTLNFLIEKANGVILNNSKNLLTSLKAVSSFIKSRLDSQSVESVSDLLAKKISVRKTVLDSSNKSLINDGSGALVISQLSEEVVNGSREDLDRAESVLLTSSNELGSVLKVSSDSNIEVQELYAMGYGEGSEDIKIEKIQVIEDEAQLQKVSEGEPTLDLDKVMVFINGDSARHTGAAILTKKGELLALDAGPTKDGKYRIGIKLIK